MMHVARVPCLHTLVLSELTRVVQSGAAYLSHHAVVVVVFIVVV